MNKTSLPSPLLHPRGRPARRNLTLIRDVAQRAGVEIILAFKAYALWKTFPIIREYVPHSTASSIYEAQLAYEEMGAKAHTFSPAYTREEFPTILRYSSHVTFNSLSQVEQMRPLMPTDGSVSFGLRVNPEYSAVETDLYNPCAPGSRFGVPAAELTELPEGIEGFHFHSLCEGDVGGSGEDAGDHREELRALPPSPQVAQYGRWAPDDPSRLRCRASGQRTACLR